MVFQNKAGLWLLLGIPVLIIIYLIRSHHEDYPVSSTYIWRLSARFRRKRLPMQKLRRIMLFLTQLLLIAAAAGILSGPSVSNGDCCNYIVILDSSASMQTEDETGTSRFDRALAQIKELSEYIRGGHRVSLITASDTSSVVLDSTSSAADLKRAINDLACTDGSLNIDAAVELAETVAGESELSAVIFYTDSDYETSEGTEVVNVSSGEWNAAVTAVSSGAIKTAVTRISSSGSTTTSNRTTGTEFTGLIYSENRAETVTVGLKINGSVKDVCELELAENAVTEVVFEEDGITSYDTAEIYIVADDGLSIDNSYCICRQQSGTSNVLVVSDSPLYLKTCFEVLEDCRVTVVGTEDETDYSGYDLYVFDGFCPETLPSDGSLLIINSEAEGLVTYKDIIRNESLVSKSDTSGMSAKLTGLTADMSFTEIYISTYSPVVPGSGWTSILSCGDDCVMAVRQLDSGLTQTVLSFDLHDSNLPMLPEFVYLMRNIMKASLPSILYETDYVLGESFTFTVLPSADIFYLEEPSGDIVTLSITGSSMTFTPDETGVYTAIETNSGGGSYADFFVHPAESESYTAETGELKVDLGSRVTDEDGDAGAGSGSVKQALSPLWYWFALAALILLIAEWEIYYYEQY